MIKILLYKGDYNNLKKSGIGKSILYQEKILKENNICYTTNENDDFNIVQINGVFPKSFFFAKKCKKKGIKIIYYAHSTEEDFKNTFKFSNIFSKLYKMWLIKCYQLGDVIITPTEYSKKLIKKDLSNKKIFVISNGIDLNFYDRNKSDPNAFLKKYNYKPNDKIIMSAGLFFERKGILDFIELAKYFKNYKFIWFGDLDFKYIPRRISYAIKNKPENVTFAGFVSSIELRDAYVGSDIFVFMSKEETEGMVLYEALALKTQIIINDIPIYKNMRDGIDVYKANSILEFKNKISKILNNKLMNLTDRGYDLVKIKNLSVISEKLKEVYKYVV